MMSEKNLIFNIFLKFSVASTTTYSFAHQKSFLVYASLLRYDFLSQNTTRRETMIEAI